MSTKAAFLLAAGAGRRFDAGTNKLLADFRGRPLITWALQAMLDAGFEDQYVIVGSTDLSSVVPTGVELVANPDWASGQASSLATAVATAQGADLGSFVVGLADQPLVPAEAWRRVAGSSSSIAVATYAGRRRNPVRLDRTVWRLLPVSGDRGAGPLIRERADLVEEIPCPGNPADIDTLEDLTRWS